MSIVAGIVAGVLGLTNLAGFGAYAVMMALVAGSLFFKCQAKPTTFFMRTSQITYEGVTAEAMTFVLFWTCVPSRTPSPCAVLLFGPVVCMHDAVAAQHGSSYGHQQACLLLNWSVWRRDVSLGVGCCSL
jgi:hypothetical protein